MIINLSPQRRDDALAVSKTGDVLTINGEQFDFSTLPNGATLPRDAVPCVFLAGDVERIDGQLVLALILPHGPNPRPHVALPDPIVDPPDGVIVLPTSEAFHVDA